jgi:hypothetical protein
MTEHTFVFVGGLHRSGTTLLTHLLRAHPQVSGFHDTGVREDEGQHLQDTYAPARHFGGSGRFAFDPRAHLVEVDRDTAAQHHAELLASWNPHWDLSRRVLVEKSPPNLIRMRYLQSVFPGARFLVIIRNPVTTALATKKWRRRESLWALIKHWVAAHDIATDDAKHIDHFLLVRYEDLIADPAATLASVQRFIQVEPAALETDVVNASASDAYGAQWRALNKLYVRALKRRFGDDVARHGYALEQP